MTSDTEPALAARAGAGSNRSGWPAAPLELIRPDIVKLIHDGYLDTGVDCVTITTFVANHSNLGEYCVADRTGELAEAGAHPRARDLST